MKELLEYHKECFGFIDCIHFNSEMTRHEYEKALGEGVGRTVSITHGGIKDNRSQKTFTKEGLVIGFIGNDAPYKGLQVLLNATRGLDVDVMIWGGSSTKLSNHTTNNRAHYRGKFCKEQLPSVYREMDILVVPSVWKETFSLVALEALSFGVPVIVSDNVGAQDIVKEYDVSFVYHTEMELRALLSELVDDKSRIIAYNKAILENPWKHDIKEHTKEIIEKIYKE